MRAFPTSQLNSNGLYFLAALASLILSLWLNHHATIVNPDAICYLLSAEAFQSGITKTMHLCGQAKWPFYSVLIYSFAKISHLSFEHAAYVIDSLFTLTSVLVFILIIKELGGSRLSQTLGAVIILLAHDFNSVREYIIRDHGFWAFYLLSVLFLLRFFKEPRFSLAMFWSVSLVVATLFRIEGAVFLLFLPFISWFCVQDSLWTRLKHFLLLYTLPLSIILLFSIWSLFHSHQSLENFGRVTELTNQLVHGFSMVGARFIGAKAALAQYVLNADSAHQAGWLLFFLFIIWFFYSIVINLSWSYALLTAYAWFFRVTPFSSKHSLVLVFYLLINVAITLIFLLEHLFLSNRYLLALSLILMIWVPFALEDLIQKFSLIKYRVFLFITTLGIVVSGLGGVFDFGYSKAYVREAGNWIQQHIPLEASLYVNDYQLMYYSNHFGEAIFDKPASYFYPSALSQVNPKDYQYLALRVPKKEIPELLFFLKKIVAEPLISFHNKRGDQVVIFKTSQTVRSKA